MSNYVTKFGFSLILTLLVTLLLLIQPDFGQTLIIVLSWLTLIFISGINLLLLGLIAIIGIFFLLYAAFYIPKFGYIKNRLLSFFNSETGTYNFQSDKAIESITSGGFLAKE